MWYTRRMTIAEAFRQGIYKLRKPNWANRGDRIELQLVQGGYGPWAWLISPMWLDISEQLREPELAQEMARQQVLILTDRSDDWLEWSASDVPDSASTVGQSPG